MSSLSGLSRTSSVATKRAAAVSATAVTLRTSAAPPQAAPTAATARTPNGPIPLRNNKYNTQQPRVVAAAPGCVKAPQQWRSRAALHPY